jgi:hypothetical protein
MRCVRRKDGNKIMKIWELEEGKIYVWTSGRTSFTVENESETNVWNQAKLYKEE